MGLGLAEVAVARFVAVVVRHLVEAPGLAVHRLRVVVVRCARPSAALLKQ